MYSNLFIIYSTAVPTLIYITGDRVFWFDVTQSFALTGGITVWVKIFLIQYQYFFSDFSLSWLKKFYTAANFALTGPFVVYPLVYTCYVISLLNDDLSSSTLPTFNETYYNFIGYLFLTATALIVQIEYLPNVKTYLILLEQEAAQGGEESITAI